MGKKHGDVVWEGLGEHVPIVLWYMLCGPFVLLLVIVKCFLHGVGRVLGGIFEALFTLVVEVFVWFERGEGCGCLLPLIILAVFVTGILYFLVR